LVEVALKGKNATLSVRTPRGMRSGVKKHHWLFFFDRILKVGWLLSKQ